MRKKSFADVLDVLENTSLYVSPICSSVAKEDYLYCVRSQFVDVLEVLQYSSLHVFDYYLVKVNMRSEATVDRLLNPCTYACTYKTKPMGRSEIV